MHTTDLRKVGGSIMLAVPPALLDILRLRPGAKVGIAVRKRPAGRGAAANGPAIRWMNCWRNAIRRPGAARKSANGSTTSRRAASCSDEARRNLAGRA